MEEDKINSWLARCADTLAFPLKRKRWKMRHEDVYLGITVYKTRWSETFYFELDIYNEELPRSSPYSAPSLPIITRRLQNRIVKRSDGSHPELAIRNTVDVSLLAHAKEQLILQGREMFGVAHSLETLLAAANNRTLLGYEPSEDFQLDRLVTELEGFLAKS